MEWLGTYVGFAMNHGIVGIAMLIGLLVVAAFAVLLVATAAIWTLTGVKALGRGLRPGQ